VPRCIAPVSLGRRRNRHMLWDRGRCRNGRRRERRLRWGRWRRRCQRCRRFRGGAPRHKTTSQRDQSQ
jgi:hypothetical protein